MINVQEFARRLSTLGADTFTSDDVVDLATAADVRISADLEIDATLAQRLLDQISPTPPVTGVQIAASQWPPPTSSRPAAPSVSFSSPGAVDAVLGLRVVVGDPALDELAGERHPCHLNARRRQPGIMHLGRRSHHLHRRKRRRLRLRSPITGALLAQRQISAVDVRIGGCTTGIDAGGRMEPFRRRCLRTLRMLRAADVQPGWLSVRHPRHAGSLPRY